MPAVPTGDRRPEPGPDAETQEIQADIERTRAELGETAEALATKLDVPRQVHEKVEQTKQNLNRKSEPLRRNAVPIAAAAAAGFLVLMLLRRRSRRREGD